nr:uncharacterized protein LOC124806948 [Hydra vulgaris]
MLICRIIKSEVKRSRINYEQDLIKKAKQNPKLLYKYINNQFVVKDSIKALLKDDGHISQDQIEIANILNKCFQDIFVIEPDGALPKFESRFNNCATNFSDISLDEINFNDVLMRLQSLNKNKAFGPDKLHPAMLKNVSETFALPLTIIFRESLASSQLPIQFRSANITPLFKKSDKAVAANYRPVFLTSVVGKILEVDVVLLNFAKAFDTVPHNRLLLKLRAYGIDGLVLKWIAYFLTNRRQKVVMGDKVSYCVEVFSGVPQVNSDLCVKEIQLLKFNINKCVVMHYGSSNKSYPLFINGIKLHDSKSKRDLGVIFLTNLKWKDQVTIAIGKANQMLGRLKKSFASFDCQLIKSLYLTFICPLLELAIPVWFPYMKGDCNAIEKIQHRATKIVSSISNLKYEDRLIVLGLTTLTERRKREDLIAL